MTDCRSQPKSTSSVQDREGIARQLEPTSVEFRDVFEKEFEYVVRTLRYLGVGAVDLEDVAHDVFLHVFRHLAEFDPARPLRPWLYGFAYRIARDFRMLHRHREICTNDFSCNFDPGPRPDAALLRQQMQSLALLALEGLDADERGVFVAIELDEMSAPEVAEGLNVPVNTVYSRLRRARSKFEIEVRRLGTRERLL